MANSLCIKSALPSPNRGGLSRCPVAHPARLVRATDAQRTLDRDISTVGAAVLQTLYAMMQLGRTMRRVYRKVVITTFVVGHTLLINLLQLLALLFVYPVSKRAYHACIHSTQEMFGVLMVAMLHIFCPLAMVLSGDRTGEWDVTQKVFVTEDAQRNVILLSNHQTYADWIYAFAFAYFHNMHGRLKIILKAHLFTMPMKWVPVMGWVSFYRHMLRKQDPKPLCRACNFSSLSLSTGTGA